jgi:Fur family transcriptional regulator, ferric uptake regulator
MDPREHFRQFIKTKGLKITQQRDAIVETFFSVDTHASVEELYAEIKKTHPGIGFATVYRTLKLLKESGLAREWNFGDGHARYEHVLDMDEHHDHMICISCGAIQEFENDRIERMQEQVATEHGFTVTHHTMELYGHCRACSAARAAAPRARSAPSR